MEKHISIPNDKDTIEAGIDYQHKTRAVIIMHPHSLMGGNMDNPIVQVVQQTFADKGLTTVRFNFRGVGYSTGNFDDGIGEQDDLVAVVNFLKANGRHQIDLIGYSFGAWVLAHAVQKNMDYFQAMMISPPIAFMDFSEVTHIPGLKNIVTGSHDEFAPPHLIEKSLKYWNSEAKLHIIDAADHFYSAHLANIKKIITQWTES
ncbi:alpha/beta hydrolase [Candidatus Magnetomorum sp. HK-1]|nr:alpha/beta hydrolase [Candidatus Magnetomorum sp. HK-1]